jgi:hypothetical protein
MPAIKVANPYSVHPGVAMVQKWIQELPNKTGRSLDEWIVLTRDTGPPTEKERREWLKKTHKLGKIQRGGSQSASKARARRKIRPTLT